MAKMDQYTSPKLLPPLPFSEPPLLPELQRALQVTYHERQYRESGRLIDKPLPPLVPDTDVLSLKSVKFRQKRLQELEKLHEKQKQEFESYQRRQRLYQQQGGIFHSGFDAESYYTQEQNREEQGEGMNEHVLSIRGAQVVFAIILLGFTSYGKFGGNHAEQRLQMIVMHWWRSYWHQTGPTELSFLLFLAVESLVSLTYILLTSSPSLFSISSSASYRLRRFHNPYVVFATDAFLQTCFLGGSVALAVFLKRRICFGQVCDIARASVGFGAFLWLLFLATTIHSGIAAHKRWKSGYAARPAPVWQGPVPGPTSDTDEEQDKSPPAYSQSPNSMV
jgi:hypothetical protein